MRGRHLDLVLPVAFGTIRQVLHCTRHARGRRPEDCRAPQKLYQPGVIFFAGWRHTRPVRRVQLQKRLCAFVIFVPPPLPRFINPAVPQALKPAPVPRKHEALQTPSLCPRVGPRVRERKLNALLPLFFRVLPNQRAFQQKGLFVGLRRPVVLIAPVEQPSQPCVERVVVVARGRRFERRVRLDQILELFLVLHCFSFLVELRRQDANALLRAAEAELQLPGATEVRQAPQVHCVFGVHFRHGRGRGGD
mmetsp:Transcript_8057/g.19455  ORF Transcript_8057/g.19455 Transcript_8057/m.19455 type:complete len:249 (-) Transcript_8057:581-1327(-)